MRKSIQPIFMLLVLWLFAATAHAQGALGNAVKGAAAGSVKKATQSVAKSPTLYKWPKHNFQQIYNEFHPVAPATVLAKEVSISPRISIIPPPSLTRDYGPAIYTNPAQLTRAVTTHADAARLARADKFSLVRSTPETDALHYLHTEQSFYRPEIELAQTLRQSLLQIDKLTPKNRAELQEIVNSFPGNTLQELLTNALEQNDLSSFYRDLTDYYMLDGNPVQAAYNYTLRHPHKPNLWTRRLLRSPLVESSLRKDMGHLLSKDELNPQERGWLWQTLTQMQAQYESNLRRIYASDGVQDRLAFYDRTTNALEDFIRQNGRIPKRNTLDPAERELYNDIIFALSVTASAKPEPYAGKLNQLQTVWDANQPNWWTMEETLQRFEDFLKKHPLSYPQSVHENPHVSAEETELLENIEHWFVDGPGSFLTKINDLRRQYRP